MHDQELRPCRSGREMKVGALLALLLIAGCRPAAPEPPTFTQSRPAQECARAWGVPSDGRQYQCVMDRDGAYWWLLSSRQRPTPSATKSWGPG